MRGSSAAFVITRIFLPSFFESSDKLVKRILQHEAAATSSGELGKTRDIKRVLHTLKKNNNKLKRIKEEGFFF